jgi:cell division protein FtsW (lipid II flippase)
MNTGYYAGSLIWTIVAVCVCVYMARNKGRSALGWGIFGFFFSLIAIIILLLLPSKAGARR